MLRTSFKQTLYLLREHPLLSMVSILATGLSIAMIMVIIIIWQVQAAPCEPEINRDRTLYFDLISVDGGQSGKMNTGLSPYFIQKCLYPLKHAQKVGMANSCSQIQVSVPAMKKDLMCDVRDTDDSTTMKVDVRVVSATNADLKKLIAGHEFREDVNIIKNAAESIDRKGEIYITTMHTPACLEIADNGKGIDKETEMKLFSPFFFTKPNGQGIGLILIQEILTRHRCEFSLKTEADGITRFKIYFT